MEPAKTTFKAGEGFIPNPKLRLRDQLREVVRFKQFSPRTEEAYRAVNEHAAGGQGGGRTGQPG